MFGSYFFNQSSKKKRINILITFLFIDFLLLSFYHFLNPNLGVHLDMDLFFAPTNFHTKVAKLMTQVWENKELFCQAHSELTHLELVVPINKIMVNKGEVGPSETFYDPRFTLSVYLNELTRIGNTPNLPTLPFHWVDWVSIKNKISLSFLPDIQQMTCLELKSHIRGQPEYSSFCKNREDINNEELEILGFRNRKELPQAVIFDHCPHENHCYNDIRVFMAKSYTMTHLPKPFKVIILNDMPKGGTFEFKVNQTKSSNQRLLFNGMVERFVELSMKFTFQSLLKVCGYIQVNAQREFKKLISTVTPRYLNENADVMGMYQTVRGKSGSIKDIHLQEEHFHYPSGSVDNQIEKYENITLRTVLEQSYLDGLYESSKFNGTNEPRYFKMARLNTHERRNTIKDCGWHYDWRFFNDALFYKKKGWSKAERIERSNIILERLLRNWSRFTEEKGLVSWIMHGPLLSWYWNGLFFPFDVDIDVQMPISELIRLTKEYNQTLVVENPMEGYGRYLIDVGTFIHNREQSFTGNYIDARFVDVDSGIYIDITGLAKSSFIIPRDYEKPPIVLKDEGDTNLEIYNDRRKHFYTLDQIQPLHYSMVGGVPVFVPFQVEKRLKWEYDRGLEEYEFKGWYFVPKLQLWIYKDKLKNLFESQKYPENGNLELKKMVALVKGMSDNDCLRLLQDENILMEYYLTRNFTSWHLQEKSILFTPEGKDTLTALEDGQIRQKYNALLGNVQFSRPMRKCLFEYEEYDRDRK